MSNNDHVEVLIELAGPGHERGDDDPDKLAGDGVLGLFGVHFGELDPLLIRCGIKNENRGRTTKNQVINNEST